MDLDMLPGSRAVVASGVVAGALVVPAAASADAIVTAGPVTVKGYTMTVTASDARKDAFDVFFQRSAGKATQLHSYAFATASSPTAPTSRPSARRP